MADNKVELEIDVTTKDAINSLKSFEKQATQSLGGAEKIVSGFKASFVGIGAAIAAGFAGLKIAQFFEEGIAAAAETEAAVNALGTQMKLTGDFTETALQSFVDFADEIERTTNVSDDLIIQQAAVAKAFGLTDDQTKSLLQASVEYAKIANVSLPTAVDSLLKSYNGQTKAIEGSIRAVRGLNEEQKKAGGVIDLINKQYGGTAAAALNTFEGAVESVKRAYGDFQKEIGKSVIENKNLIGLFRAIAFEFDKLSTEVGKNEISNAIDIAVSSFINFGKVVAGTLSVLERVVNGLISVIADLGAGILRLITTLASKIPGDAFDELIQGAEDTEDQLRLIGLTAKKMAVDGTGAFGKIYDKIEEVEKKTKEFAAQVKKSGIEIDKSTKDKKPYFTGEELETKRKEFKAFSNSIVAQVGSETDKIGKERDQQLEKLVDYFNKGIIEAKDYQKTALDLEEIYNDKKSKINIAANKKTADDIAKQQDDLRKVITSNPIAYVVKAVFENVTQDKKFDESFIKAGAIVATGFLNNIQKGGKEAAVDFGSDISGAIGSFFGGSEVGGFFSSLFKFSAQDEKQIKEQVTNLFAQFPSIFANTVAFAPAFVEAIIDVFTSSDFGIRFVESIGRALSANGDAFARRFGIKAGDSFNETIGNVFEGIKRYLGELFTVDFFKELGRQISKGFKEAVDDLGPKISKSFDKFIANIEDSALAKALNGFIKNVTKVFNDFGLNISNTFKTANSQFNSFNDKIKKTFSDVNKQLLDAFHGFNNLVKETFEQAGASISDKFKSAMEDIFNTQLAIQLGGLYDNLKNFVINFGNSISEFLKSFVASIGTLFSQIGEALRTAFDTIKNALAPIGEAIGNIAVKIREGIGEAFDKAKNFFSDGFNKLKGSLSGVFNDFIDKLKSALGGGDVGKKISSGGKSALGKLGIPGFAEGGVVPPGFPNDTYPAFLTSGESVVPQGKSLPDDESSAKIIALLSQLVAKSNLPQTVETSVNFNGRALADIILQLNRNNARLAG